ncbi:MAG TPA: type II secretion system protein GspG, partial [Candidatus Polarisedimenticolaceae bacterium]|nr:type II secretion system protein GspG [Candidatus Polarisedimenticolaceae bacterium]
IVVAIIGIIAAIAIPNLLNAIDRGKQKRTMADLRSIGTAIESYAIDNVSYPTAGTNLASLTAVLEPLYLRQAPTNDGWNRTFSVACAATEYTVCSGGKDGGACVNDAGGTTTSFNDSITFANGQFVQWPEGAQQ